MPIVAPPRQCWVPDIFAYWKPPPSWPRRLLCENCLCKCSLLQNSRRVYSVVAVVVISYFLMMDVVMFSNFRNQDIASVDKDISKDEMYTPFTRLSVKALLNDHISQFGITPSSEYFDMITHFSTTFTFITPNMISIFHLCVGFMAGKFMSSSDLMDRRIGVALYFFRTWLDAFDGTVHRSQSNLHLQYNSTHQTLGYYFDAICDIFGGVFLSFAIIFWMMKRNILESNGKAADKEALLPTTSGPVVIPSFFSLFLKGFFSIGITLLISGKCWDLSVLFFTHVFQTSLDDVSLKILQFDMCHSTMTLILFYLWRIFAGQCILNYALLAVWMDKTEVILKICQYVLLPVSIVLFTVTYFYTSHIESVLLL